MDEELVVINSDAKAIFDEAMELHNNISDEQLPISSETTFIYSTIAALLSTVKAEMNEVAIQNYLKYARGKRLDLKGDIYGKRGKRLEANYALTTMKCYISSVVGRDVIIPKGTRFIKDKYIFESTRETKILKGETSVDIIVSALEKGEIATILKGEITTIVDAYDYYERCENITDVTGGVNEEDDERYRDRIYEIPESFTTAGSEGSYIFNVKRASTLVDDVRVDSPTVNVINIYVLGKKVTKISNEEKNKIKEAVNSKEIRPLGDLVSVLDPEFIDYTMDLEYTVYDNNLIKIPDLNKNIKDALEKYTESFKIGDSLNTQDIIKLLKDIGLKRINLKSPGEIQTEKNQVLNCSEIKVSYLGEK